MDIMLRKTVRGAWFCYAGGTTLTKSISGTDGTAAGRT